MGERDLQSVKEKRISRRIRSLNLTSYTPKKGDQQEYIVSIGRTLDVSEGGVKVEIHRKLAEGTELDMDIAIEDEIITARGEVVHTEELKNGLYGTGIRFTSISDEDRKALR
jgi:c-di-GMP-binding flagellar brake protein YcgR